MNEWDAIEHMINAIKDLIHLKERQGNAKEIKNIYTHLEWASRLIHNEGNKIK